MIKSTLVRLRGQEVSFKARFGLETLIIVMMTPWIESVCFGICNLKPSWPFIMDPGGGLQVYSYFSPVIELVFSKELQSVFSSLCLLWNKKKVLNTTCTFKPKAITVNYCKYHIQSISQKILLFPWCFDKVTQRLPQDPHADNVKREFVFWLLELTGYKHYVNIISSKLSCFIKLTSTVTVL